MAASTSSPRVTSRTLDRALESSSATGLAHTSPSAVGSGTRTRRASSHTSITSGSSRVAPSQAASTAPSSPPSSPLRSARPASPGTATARPAAPSARARNT